MPYFYPNGNSGSRQCVNVVLAVDTTTTSTTYVNLVTATIGTIGSSYLLIRASYSTSDTASLTTGDYYRVTVDGTVYGYAGNEIFQATESGAICVRVGPLAAGSHVVNFDWHTSTGNTVRCRPLTVGAVEHASLMITEVTV